MWCVTCKLFFFLKHLNRKKPLQWCYQTRQKPQTLNICSNWSDWREWSVVISHSVHQCITVARSNHHFFRKRVHDLFSSYIFFFSSFLIKAFPPRLSVTLFQELKQELYPKITVGPWHWDLFIQKNIQNLSQPMCQNQQLPIHIECRSRDESKLSLISVILTNIYCAFYVALPWFHGFRVWLLFRLWPVEKLTCVALVVFDSDLSCFFVDSTILICLCLILVLTLTYCICDDYFVWFDFD